MHFITSLNKPGISLKTLFGVDMWEKNNKYGTGDKEDNR
jgi:hypothetical protein